MGRKKRERKAKKPSSLPRHTPLSRHAKKGSTLTPPLAALPLQTVNWERDLLPEHLLIACLADRFGLDSFHGAFTALMDAIDEVWEEKDVAWGLVSDFGLIPQAKRSQFLASNASLLEDAVLDSAAGILSLYPACPAAWILPATLGSTGVDLDELARLRRLVEELLRGKEPFAARIRMMPFSRLVKHGRIHFAEGLEITELLPRYPGRCTDEERRKAEAMVRAAMNVEIPERESLGSSTWARDFWRRNGELTDCKPAFMVIRSGKLLTEDRAEVLKKAVIANIDAAEEYLSALAQAKIPDIYSPQRDEVMLGLFARITRLYVALAANPELWPRDLGSILCRCLADTVITFCYLAKRGTDEDFAAFIRHGEGQEKLLMLHLEESYPGETSAEGRDAGMISTGLGAFAAEALSIELGHWNKKDTRKLAQEIGMEKLYHLVFSPMSSDVHGTWASIKAANLAYCTEPLHRYHRLPAVTEPPLYLTFVALATELYERSVDAAVAHLGYPHPKTPVTAAPLLRESMTGGDTPPT